MKRTGLLVLKVGISLALLAYLLSTTDMGALTRRVRGGDTLLLGAAVLLYSLMLACATWRWSLLLRALGYPAPLRDLSASYLVATFFNNFLPSNIGGDVIRVRDSSRLTGSTTTSLAVVAVDRLLGFGALWVLAVFAYAAGGPPVRHLAGAQVVLAGLAIVFALVAYVFFRPGTAGALLAALGLGRFPWAAQHFELLQSAVRTYRASLPSVGAAFGASVALQTAVIWYYFTIAHALRIPLSLSACFLMVPLCTLVQAVPVSFNGWGIRESLFILYFRQVDLGPDAALAFSLVGAGLIVVLSLSGAIVWTARGGTPAPDPAR